MQTLEAKVWWCIQKKEFRYK